MRKAIRKSICLAAAVLMCAAPVRAAEGESILPNGSEVYHLLLIGSDKRDDSWNGNSDVVMVATINTAAEKLCLTSFMRDLYADIPGYGVHKLNYAYAAGGAETLEETLESNYGLHMDNYAAVDFETMADIVDLAGGVDITVSDAEAEWLNGYLVSMESEEDFIPGGGAYTLNGMQSVAYMRIRFVGDNDYQRTQRQRDVMKGIFASMKELDAQALAAVTQEIFGKVDHDLGITVLLKLMAGMPEFMTYSFEESRVPFDGLYSSSNEMLVPDFPATIERLQESLYEGI